MPFQVADRVKESSTTTGTGAITLAGALTGFRAFSSVCSVGDMCNYALQQVDANGNPSGVWETGIGTYSASNTLTRTTVLSSSNSNAAVTLAGTTHVWIDAPAAALQALADRNAVVDGNFDSWQVGTSFSAGAGFAYTADMWQALAGIGGTATISQLAIGPEAPPAWITTPRKYKLRFNQTVAASTSPGLMQPLEGVARYSGRSITVSVSLVAAAAATLVTQVQAVQNFGTGGSPSSQVATAVAVTWAVGTTESRFSVRINVPSIAGKTLGTNGDDKLLIIFYLATGATFTLDFSQVQVEESSPSSSGDTTGSGGAPTPFEYRGQPLELARVKRYVEVLTLGSLNICAGIAPNVTSLYGWRQFTPKRSNPAVSIASGSITANAQGWNNASTVVQTSGVDTLQLANTTGSGGTSNSSGYFFGSSSASVLIDARL